MQRICEVIERDEQYLTPRLKLSDIAAELGVSVTAISDCIGSQRNCTFAQLIAEYRVRYAQQLLADNPDMKLSTVMTKSGFTSETTFYRTFKAVTGQSPKATFK
ncbi:MAG: AraC family transcriptional regulator [Prevotella sp.]|nr:AraC family transcriptional regulator [Prevotella sp.]